MGSIAYVKVFLSWMDDTRKLKDAEKGRLVDAMVAYAMGDTDVDSRLTGNEAYVFPIFQARLDRDMAEFQTRSKANSQNGKKGGAPSGNSNAKTNQDKPKQTKTSEKNEIGKEKEKEEDKEKEKEKEKDTPPKSPKKPEMDLSGFGQELQDSIKEWLQYKKEKRSTYGPTALKRFLAEIKSKAEQYGEPAIVDLISKSMTNNWQGVFFDRLERRQDRGSAGNVPTGSSGNDWGNIESVPLE